MAELLLKNSSVGHVESVIFDKDGTLSNSEEQLLELAKARIIFLENILYKLKVNKLKVIILKKILKNIYGIRHNHLAPNSMISIASRDDNIISTATIINLFNFDWPKSLSISQQVFDKVDLFLCKEGTHHKKTKTLIAGALDLLVSLKSKGVCLALMTNDTNSGIEEFISKNKLEGLFDYFWSSENRPSKPNPHAVIELCKKMHLKPSECALISDADTDLKMAKEADIPIIIGFTGGWKNPPALTENQFIIEKLNELNIQINT